MSFLIFKANKLDTNGALSKDAELDIILIISSDYFKGSVNGDYYTTEDPEGLLITINNRKYVQLRFSQETILGDELGFLEVTASDTDDMKRKNIKINTSFLKAIVNGKVFTKFNEPILFGKKYYKDFELPGLK